MMAKAEREVGLRLQVVVGHTAGKQQAGRQMSLNLKRTRKKLLKCVDKIPEQRPEMSAKT